MGTGKRDDAPRREGGLDRESIQDPPGHWKDKNVYRIKVDKGIYLDIESENQEEEAKLMK